MINVLIVDGDAMVAKLNRLCVVRVPDFRCSGGVSTLSQTQEMINDKQRETDLALLGAYMQQDSGLDPLPTIRESGHAIDVIMITSAVDAATVQIAMHYGVADYLTKPLQFLRFEGAFTTWWEKYKLMTGQPYHEQVDVGRLLHGGVPETSNAHKLPKGLTAQMPRMLCQWIDARPDVEFSTDEPAAAVNISRVSCRKYLIRLAQISILYTTIHRGATGQPVYRYRLAAEQYSLLKQYSQQPNSHCSAVQNATAAAMRE